MIKYRYRTAVLIPIHVNELISANTPAALISTSILPRLKKPGLHFRKY